jgi:hypothetical protein
MGISIGWIALLLGVTGAQPADKNAAQITYTVRMVEAEGVGWRAAVMSQLKPVTRQGSATVWTLPASASSRLIEEIAKNSTGSGKVSRVIAFSGVPATIQVRENRKFVTHVSWNSDEAKATGTPENLRVGWHSTLIGRKLDQGILVKMVFEDTEVRHVHQVTLDRPSDPKDIKSGAPSPSPADRDVKTTGFSRDAFANSPFEEPETTSSASARSETDCPESRCPFSCPDGIAEKENRLLQLPEIASQEVLGEWLIPSGECLLVSFGPHTEADQDGKAVVRERLAFIEADAKPVAVTAQRVMTAPPYVFTPAARVLIAPSVMAPPAVYVPYSPNGTPLHGFPPAGAPAAPVVVAPAPEVPLPSGRYMHDDVKYMPSYPDFPWANTQAATERARKRAMGVEPPPPVGGAPAAVAPAAPDGVTRMPAVPSRSFPQGVHVDGSKAKLPPLPDDEMDDDTAKSESAEPRPSPQKKVPRKSKPAADESTTKASFVKPKSSTFILPSVFLPGASVGFQFLLPITPLSIKLPFNQRLVIEIFGRVVPDTRAAETAN